MKRRQQQTVLCQICKQQKQLREVVTAASVREPVVETIQKTHPDWSPSGFVCLSDLNQFRAKYVQDVLQANKGELSALEDRVMRSLKEEELLSANINIEFAQRLTLGERLADKMASHAGSWRFLIGFAIVLILWIALNSVVLVLKPFDPNPFILLNLVLSCLAAVQAPIIIMSQKRQEARDRLRAEHDYLINLKAELEIRHLHEKMDHLLMNQWQRLLEIQEVQTDLMEELARKIP